MKTITKLLTLIFISTLQYVISQTNGSQLEYCNVYAPQGNNYIVNVDFAGIHNASGLGLDGYSEFLDKKAYLDKGAEYDLEVETKWTHWPYLTIQAWIDWNGNMDFEASERVLYNTGRGPISGRITVPEDANFGATRMRIRYNYDTPLGPCEIDTYKTGEIEDYMIVVSGPDRPSANFGSSSQYINDDKDLVEYVDQSTNNPTGWYWEFEGGIPSVSTSQHPLVRYIHSGSYSVKLTVNNEFGEDVTYMDNYMNVQIPTPTYAPLCNFSTVLTSVSRADEYVRFDDLSENEPTSWFWEFEGATPATSTEQIPQVTYSQSGSYSVKLTVSNSTGYDSKTREDYITVNLDPCTSHNERPIGQYITRVEFAQPNSSTYDDGYELYDISGNTVERGSIEYPNEASIIRVRTNAVWENTKLGVWVDWNQDNTFSDPEERHNLAKPSSSDGDWLSFLVVPEDAKLGETILRVRTVYGEELSPCGDAWFGETEDYVINVIEAPYNSDRSSTAKNIRVNPNPSSDGIFNFDFDEPTRQASFKVFNGNGIEIYAISNTVTVDKAKLNLSHLNSGLYTVQIQTEIGLETTRIIIR